MHRKVILAGLAVAGVIASTAETPAQPRAVLELFTSQGCSSCPPADKLLGEYVARDDILALSFNIDYWDYLGWKDTLASHEFSERQKAYSEARGDRQVYTPQIVVNGGEHVVGSNRTALDAAVSRAEASGLPVPIALTSTDDAVHVNIGAATDPTQTKGTAWLVMYEPTVTVPIARGENRGETITYHNVVKKLRPIAMWKGEAMSVDLPKSEMSQAKVGRCAVLLQTEKHKGLPGMVLGAAALPPETR
ncbi:MAG: DUF1223 domain-containing protein [Bauldia sp.]